MLESQEDSAISMTSFSPSWSLSGEFVSFHYSFLMKKLTRGFISTGIIHTSSIWVNPALSPPSSCFASSSPASSALPSANQQRDSYMIDNSSLRPQLPPDFAEYLTLAMDNNTNINGSGQLGPDGDEMMR